MGAGDGGSQDHELVGLAGAAHHGVERVYALGGPQDADPVPFVYLHGLVVQYDLVAAVDGHHADVRRDVEADDHFADDVGIAAGDQERGQPHPHGLDGFVVHRVL